MPRLSLAVIAGVVLAAVSLGGEGRAGPAVVRPLQTAIMDLETFNGPDEDIGLDRSRAAGASLVRLALVWRAVAPLSRPASFQAANPSDPAYRWDLVDAHVKAAVRQGLQPLLAIVQAPDWAERGRDADSAPGNADPNPDELGLFARAAATRYSGSTPGLPRVRYWQVWNEPNLSSYLSPQTLNGRPRSPELYRAMVNAMAPAVHAVRSDNVVIAGGQAPFGGNSNDPSGGHVPEFERLHPLEFMRQMLCMSDDPAPKPTCRATSEFDMWAHHPYTYGGPTHQAFHPDDVSLGDLGEMRRLLEGAAASGHVQSRQKVGFWVTEFSYDSRPGDPKGLPLGLHARWLSESLYRMWKDGVSLVTWLNVRDEQFPNGVLQSGLYTRGASGIASDKPKPALRAFRFPFVAFRQKGSSITFWGRTPTSSRRAVVVEQKQGSRWRSLVAPAVDRYGIFQGRVTSKAAGSLRARLVSGEASLPFNLTVPADFRFCPWGSFC